MFFFFQAEDGIRDIGVTGVQTCALPISIEATTVGTWDKVVAVTQTSVFLGMKAAAEALKASGHGSVVNISSMYGIVGSGVSPAYHAAKGAVRLLTKTTALGWAKAGVRVNSVHPGRSE